MTLVDQINAATRRIPAWPLYGLAVIPVVWVFYAGITGQLGVDPAKAIEHRMGLWSLWLLIAGLTITPLARFTGVRLTKYRRAIGVTTFFYVLVHLLVWLVLDVQILSEIWKDILKRPYITIGMVAFALLVPLALTSNNWSIRKLGAKTWQRLHKLTYGIAILGAVHFVMLVKGWQLEPFLYLTAILVLLGLRLVPRRRPTLRPAMAVERA